MTYRNDQLSLATYPKDTIWGQGATGRIVYDIVASSLEVDFAFEICNTKDKAWYVACFPACFLENSCKWTRK